MQRDAGDGRCLRANATFEDVTGQPRRALQKSLVQDWLVDPRPLADTLRAVADSEVTTGRFDALLLRSPALGAGHGELPVHVIVSPTDWPGQLVVEMIEIDFAAPVLLLRPLDVERFPRANDPPNSRLRAMQALARWSGFRR